MKNLSTTKSNDLISHFFTGQASRPCIYLKLAEFPRMQFVQPYQICDLLRRHKTPGCLIRRCPVL